MKLWVTGLNHRTAPVEVRERLAIDAGRLAGVLRELKQRPGMMEGLVLSTCNRVEVAVAAEDQCEPQAAIESFIAETLGVETDWLRRYLYHFDGREAIHHIFRVAASLDSMVVGEPQILGQLKAAYAAAKAEGALNGQLEIVLSRAFGVAKRVRTETEIGMSAVSVSYAAVELAREIFGSLKGRKVMLIGAGKMSELAGRHLHRSGVGDVLVTNRTRSRAEELAGHVSGRVVAYETYPAHLHEADIVITSSGATGYLLDKDTIRRVLQQRRGRPMFLIDIAVPRNIDPAVNELEGAFVYDIDDLQKVVDTNLKGRLDEAAEADKIVAEEVERLESWMRARQAGPLIQSLQQQLEQIRAAEVERMRAKLGPLTVQQEEALEALTRGLMNKVAHGPIAELRKHAGSATGSAMVEAIRNIFRLPD